TPAPVTVFPPLTRMRDQPALENKSATPRRPAVANPSFTQAPFRLSPVRRGEGRGEGLPPSTTNRAASQFVTALRHDPPAPSRIKFESGSVISATKTVSKKNPLPHFRPGLLTSIHPPERAPQKGTRHGAPPLQSLFTSDFCLLTSPYCCFSIVVCVFTVPSPLSYVVVDFSLIVVSLSLSPTPASAWQPTIAALNNPNTNRVIRIFI